LRYNIMDKKQQDEFKSVKQRLSKIQLVIKKELKEDRLPAAADTEQFMSISDEMNNLCHEKWRKTMDDYMVLLGQFQTAIRGGDLQRAQDGFHRLLDGKASCHKKYRQK